MAQFLRPTSDLSAGSWTTAPLWSKIDEGSDGGDTIQSEDVANNVNTSNADFGCNSIDDPAVSTGHILRARWASSLVRDMTPHLELWQGTAGSGTLIAALVPAELTGTTEQTDTYTLSGAEADNITDYGDLDLRLWGRGTGGGPSRALVVEFAELETPDASADVNINHSIEVSTMTDFAPTVRAGVDISHSAEVSTLLDFVPGIGAGVDVSHSIEVATFTSFLPAVLAGVDVSHSIEVSTLVDFIPTISIPIINVVHNIEVSTLVDFAPTVRAGVDIAHSIEVATLVDFIPTVAAGVDITHSIEVSTLEDFIPAVLAGVDISHSIEVATLVDFIPTITTSGPTNINHEIEVSTLVDFIPKIFSTAGNYVIDRMKAAGSEPTQHYKDAIAPFADGLFNEGIWAITDQMFVPPAETKIQSLTPWEGKNGTESSGGSGITFTKDVGIKAASATDYFDTNWIWGVDNVHALQNDHATVAGQDGDSGQGQANYGVEDASNADPHWLFIDSSIGGIAAAKCSIGQRNEWVSVDGKGFWIVNRTTSTLATVYKNDSVIDSDNSNSDPSIMVNSIVLCNQLIDGATTANAGLLDANQQIYWIGKGLTASQRTEFQALWEQFVIDLAWNHNHVIEVSTITDFAPIIRAGVDISHNAEVSTLIDFVPTIRTDRVDINHSAEVSTLVDFIPVIFSGAGNFVIDRMVDAGSTPDALHEASIRKAADALFAEGVYQLRDVIYAPAAGTKIEALTPWKGPDGTENGTVTWNVNAGINAGGADTNFIDTNYNPDPAVDGVQFAIDSNSCSVLLDGVDTNDIFNVPYGLEQVDPNDDAVWFIVSDASGNMRVSQQSDQADQTIVANSSPNGFYTIERTSNTRIEVLKDESSFTVDTGSPSQDMTSSDVNIYLCTLNNDNTARFGDFTDDLQYFDIGAELGLTLHTKQARIMADYIVEINGGDTIRHVIETATLVDFIPTITTGVGDTTINHEIEVSTLVDFVPIIRAGVDISHSAEVSTLVDFVPTILIGVDINHTIEVATLTDFVPTITLGVDINHSVEVATLVDFIPTIVIDITIPHSIEVSTLVDFVPAILAGVDISHTIEIATLVDFIPAILVGVDISHTIEIATLVDFAPTVKPGVDVNHSAEVATFVDFVPTIATGSDTTINHSIEISTLVDFVPTVNAGVDIFHSIEVATLTDFVPNIGAGSDISHSIEIATLVDFVPTINITRADINHTIEISTLVDFAVTVLAGVDINHSAEVSTFVDFIPTIDTGAGNVNINHEIEVSTLVDFAPTVKPGVDINHNAEVATIQDFVATIAAGVDILHSIEVSTFTDFVPSIQAGVRIEHSIEVSTFVDFVPTIVAGADSDINHEIEVSTLQDFVPAVNAGVDISHSIEISTLQDFVPNIAAGVDISHSIEVATLQDFVPSIRGGADVFHNIEVATLVDFIPTVVVPGSAFIFHSIEVSTLQDFAPVIIGDPANLNDHRVGPGAGNLTDERTGGNDGLLTRL
jgi:queuine/archaeosine tRNA-ribosyltransferase